MILGTQTIDPGVGEIDPDRSGFGVFPMLFQVHRSQQCYRLHKPAISVEQWLTPNMFQCNTKRGRCSRDVDASPSRRLTNFTTFINIHRLQAFHRYCTAQKRACECRGANYS